MRNPSTLKISVYGMLGCILLTAFICSERYIGLNMAPSLPYHVFFLKLKPAGGDIVKGAIVMFRHDHPMAEHIKTMNLYKRVACVEGERLQVEGLNYYCSGVFLGKAKTRSLAGLPVKNFEYNGEVPRGELFVLGDHKDSYDSRYFGFIRKKEVTALAYPLF